MMWAPLDPNSLLDDEDIIQMRNIIASLYGELGDLTGAGEDSASDPQTDALHEELAHRNAFIAPIQRIPTEILALIMIAHSALDWMAPMTVGLVCRSWRETLLLTPRAWSFIQVHSRKLPDKLIRTWLERCASVPLHISLNQELSASALDTVMKFSRNIVCIAIPPRFYQYLADHEFPNLVQLFVSDTLKGGRWWNRNYGVDLSAFPRLQSLHLTDNANDTFSIKSIQTGFAPLQELNIWSNDSYGGWLKVIQCCSGTLNSLAIRMNGRHMADISPTTIHLPLLRYLFLSLEHSQAFAGRFPLALKTPKLECYDERNTSLYLPILHDDVKTVTELVLESTITRDLRQLPSLRRLHLNLQCPAGSPTLRILGIDNSLCPEIEHIELYHSGDWSFLAESAIRLRMLTTSCMIRIAHSDKDFSEVDSGYNYKTVNCGQRADCCQML